MTTIIETDAFIMRTDFRVRVAADFEPGDPDTGIQSGWIIEEIELIGLQTLDDGLVLFRAPGEISPSSLKQSEYDALHDTFEAIARGERVPDTEVLL
jgi:hypothetical protein